MNHLGPKDLSLQENIIEGLEDGVRNTSTVQLRLDSTESIPDEEHKQGQLPSDRISKLLSSWRRGVDHTEDRSKFINPLNHPSDGHSFYTRVMDSYMDKQETVSKASDIQVGGDHYKKYPIQPGLYSVKNDLGYFEGAIVDYITRYQDKGGTQDLEKIKHCVDLILEWKYDKPSG